MRLLLSMERLLSLLGWVTYSFYVLGWGKEETLYALLLPRRSAEESIRKKCPNLGGWKNCSLSGEDLILHPLERVRILGLRTYRKARRYIVRWYVSFIMVSRERNVRINVYRVSCPSYYVQMVDSFVISFV